MRNAILGNDLDQEPITCLKAGVHLNFIEILAGKFKEGLKGGKKVMEHHQTVA